MEPFRRHLFVCTQEKPEGVTSCPAGGRLVVQEFILEPDKTAPRFAALFSLNMLVNTQGGSSYSEPEYGGWLREAGFRDVRRARLPGPTGLMVATRD